MEETIDDLSVLKDAYQLNIIPYKDYEEELLQSNSISTIYESILSLKILGYFINDNNVMTHIFKLLYCEEYSKNLFYYDYISLVELLKITSQNEIHKQIIKLMMCNSQHWFGLLDYLIYFLEKINTSSELINMLKNNPDFEYMYYNFSYKISSFFTYLNFERNDFHDEPGIYYCFYNSLNFKSTLHGNKEFQKLRSFEDEIVKGICSGMEKDYEIFLKRKLLK